MSRLGIVGANCDGDVAHGRLEVLADLGGDVAARLMAGNPHD